MQHTVESINLFVRKYEGRCNHLSSKKIGTKARRMANVSCKRNHTWDIRIDSLFSEIWCDDCKKIEKQEEVEQLAINRDGLCLSTYINNITKMLWQCYEGHQWPATYNDVKDKKSWCPVCAGQISPSQEEVEQLAISRGGRCLSNYKNNKDHLLWECSEGHQWPSSFSCVKHRGHWCPNCAGVRPLLQKEAIDYASSKEGECLSIYINTVTYMNWKCKEGHTWSATFGHMKHQGCWCPYCPNKTENYCRKIFERLFQKSFAKIRPDWLKNPVTGKNLELDGYCEEVKVAMEANGIQHYKIVKYFHKTKNDLDKQQVNDRIKVEECKKRNIDLIIIPYTESTPIKIKKFILKELQEKGWDFVEEELEGL